MPLLGRQRNRFSVRSPDQTRDARGVLPGTYTHKFYWSAQIQPGPQALVGEAGALRSEARYTLRGRYRPEFEVGDQVIDSRSSRTFYVEGLVDRDGRRQLIHVTVAERPNPGT